MSQFEMINDEQALVELSEDQLAEVTGGNNWGGSKSYNRTSYKNSFNNHQSAGNGILNGNNVSISILSWGSTTQYGGNNNSNSY